jgi:hypothetical protein
MISKKKRWVIAIGISTFLFGMVLGYFFITPNPDTGSMQGISTKGADPSLAADEPFIVKMAADLQKWYGKTISQRVTQACLLGVRDLIIGTHPGNGRSLFYAILKRAFPDYANDIMNTLAKIDQYNRWLQDNRDALMKMTALDRTAAMWKKRHELFGDDADKIWSGEMMASDVRKSKMQDTMSALNESRDTSIEEKLQVYQAALRNTYKGTPEEYFLDQNTVLSKVFFSVDSVQEELRKLSPEARQEEINNIRRQMGYSEEDIATQARYDDEREQRWQNGYQYMKERDKVVAQYQGQEQEERLQALRDKYFPYQARAIELEEKDNFFRFKRPRIYGRN